MRIVECTLEQHGADILAILNDAIVTSTALFDYEPRSSASMVEWFRVKEGRRFPVLGAVAADGTLMGFATYGAFRNFPAYKYTVEHSVYVHREHRRRGVGRALLARLVTVAEAQDYHLMVAGIDAANSASIALHVDLGFVHAGTVHQAGFKFGRWLDLALYERALRAPARPVDG